MGSSWGNERQACFHLLSRQISWLVDYKPVTWSSPKAIILNQIQPNDTTYQDKDHVAQLFNQAHGAISVKTRLEREIEKYFPSLLREIVQAKNKLPKPHLDYSWVDADRLNHTLKFESKPVIQELNRNGLRIAYEVKAANSIKWKSVTRPVPTEQLDEAVYGSTQEFISYDFYQNLLEHACNTGDLITNLNRKNWGTQTFDFTAGRLGSFINGISQRFADNQKVEGQCHLIPNHLKVTKDKSSSIHVNLHASCSLKIQETRIISFNIQMSVNANILVYNSALYFVYINHYLKNTEYYENARISHKIQAAHGYCSRYSTTKSGQYSSFWVSLASEPLKKAACSNEYRRIYANL